MSGVAFGEIALDHGCALANDTGVCGVMPVGKFGCANANPESTPFCSTPFCCVPSGRTLAPAFVVCVEGTGSAAAEKADETSRAPIAGLKKPLVVVMTGGTLVSLTVSLASSLRDVVAGADAPDAPVVAGVMPVLLSGR
jgi:hypothetical protein